MNNIFAIKFGPERNQGNAQLIRNEPVCFERFAFGFDGLADGGRREIEITSQTAHGVPLFVEDFFSIDYMLILVYNFHLVLCFKFKTFLLIYLKHT